MQPVVRRTWAPRGQTPILVENRNWDKLSVIGAITTQPGLYFEIIEGAFKGPRVLCFLVDLLTEITGDILLVWDNAAIHKTGEIKDFLARPDVAGRLEVMPLPSYAPKLNPEELINAHIKAQRLASFAPETAGELRKTAGKELRRAACKSNLLTNILASSKHGLLDRKNLCQDNL